MAYRIQFTPRAERDFAALPREAQVRLGRRIDGLAADPRPHGSRKLKNADRLYRLRSGDYRVIYEVIGKVVTITVIRVGHRRDIYR